MRAVMRLPSFMTVDHEACSLQYGKVLRDGRLRNAGLRGQNSDRSLPLSAKSLE